MTERGSVVSVVSDGRTSQLHEILSSPFLLISLMKADLKVQNDPIDMGSSEVLDIASRLFVVTLTMKIWNRLSMDGFSCCL